MSEMVTQAAAEFELFYDLVCACINSCEAELIYLKQSFPV
jgi:hypothetical protein